MFITAIPKLPLMEGLQPGGGEPVGAMEAVTACGMATGDAFTAATSARSAKVYFILNVDKLRKAKNTRTKKCSGDEDHRGIYEQVKVSVSQHQAGNDRFTDKTRALVIFSKWSIDTR